MRNIVPLSGGKIESLGVSAIHFPFQEFVLSSVPSIFNPHDLAHLHLPQFFSPDNIMRREVLYRFACQVAQRVAVASEWVARDISTNYSIARSKIAVIPWGAATAGEPTPTSADIDKLRSKYQLPREFVFYPAVAWPHKNHVTLLAALSLLKEQGNQTCLVCSGARTDLTSELEKRAEGLGVRDRVQFLNAVPQRDMRGLYRAALGVVVPTLFEALSGPMAEAWQEGIPVACSDIPQLREQGADAVLLFQPLSPASIAETLHLLTSDPKKRQHLIARGLEKIAGMDWTNAARQYRELYRDVVKETRPGGIISSEFA
ncbi:MAG: glycosyltransferase family 4 protein [Verrucomicrobiota bacterium]|nr:glycosyltransferase family 4 protein [Verrucomicrobiota bacterium]